MNYVDANILIYALDDEGAKGKASRSLILNQRLATSVLSLDEVAYKLGRKSQSRAVTAVEGLCKSESLELVPFLPQDSTAFIGLLKAGFLPRDAIHALCAKKVRASVIYSEDADFDKLDIVRKVPWKP